MIVVFDNNYFVYLLDENQTRYPVKDPSGNLVENVAEKIRILLDQLTKKKAKILVPTPVLAEIFAHFGDRTNEILACLSNDYGIQFADFNTLAAIETGMALQADARGKKKSDRREPWQKVKFDRQIVSIAKVNQAEAIYTCDHQVLKWAHASGMKAIPVWELPDLPPEQLELNEVPNGDKTDEADDDKEDIEEQKTQ